MNTGVKNETSNPRHHFFLSGCVVADMVSTNHTAFPYSWTFQKPATLGHTDRVQRKADLYAFGVDKNVDVDSPAWGRGSSYQGGDDKTIFCPRSLHAG
ncbi:hypothetical protein [Leclercia tamurae]|uniref:Uncharacterized protein n=1 Tax=Leclercia tamurae TaxID=2926467 RepID=A0ABT2RCQ4_9ENTR|nr:hypothetical protein [Leclercia tamurae]MCU6678630.1 hypothetical protein [Leclercia tamurae]